MNREKADFKATVDIEFIKHDYGLEMEGKEEAGVKEYSRVFDLGNWIVGVVLFIKKGTVGGIPWWSSD